MEPNQKTASFNFQDESKDQSKSTKEEKTKAFSPLANQGVMSNFFNSKGPIKPQAIPAQHMIVPF